MGCWMTIILCMTMVLYIIFYDKNTYPGGQNKEEHLSAKNISLKVKKRLLEASSDENKELVKSILEID